MNLPNKLTVARLLALPFFLAFTVWDTAHTRVLALLVFIGAGVTDLVDGYIARKRKLVTQLGVFLDPLADKLIITAAFIAFVEIPDLHVPAWMVVMIVGREFLITGLRAVAASRGTMVPADDGGKFKTAVQNTAIITILAAMIIRSALARYGGMTMEALELTPGWRSEAARLLNYTPFWMVFAATVFSLATGVSYLWRHRALIREEA